MSKAWKAWTWEDRLYLKENAADGADAIAAALGRTKSSVQGQAHQLGIALGDRGLWTDAEKAYLKERCIDGAREVAKVLNRTEASVNCQAQKMGLKVGGPHTKVMPNPPWTQEEIDTLKREAAKDDGWGVRVATMLNRTPESVWTFAQRNGISFAPRRHRRVANPDDWNNPLTVEVMTTRGPQPWHEEATNLRKAGWTMQAIADEVGVTYNRVRTYFMTPEEKERRKLAGLAWANNKRATDPDFAEKYRSYQRRYKQMEANGASVERHRAEVAKRRHEA